MRAGRTTSYVGAVVAGAILLQGGVRGQAADAPVPLTQEPRHHVIYDAAAFRIHDIQIPPGDTTLFHTHDTAILYVPIASSVTRTQVLGAEWSGGAAATAAPRPEPVRPGKPYSIVTYADAPHTHRVNNLGATQFRLIGIANRTAGATAAADDVSGLSAPAPELVNRWYRVHRVVLEPGAATPAHRHATAVVVVMQTTGSASSVADGGAWTPLNGPGDLARHDAASNHVVTNGGRTAIEVVEVEVRGATSR